MAYPGLVYVCAKERYPMGSKDWAQATAWAFGMLTHEVSAEVPKLVGDHVVQTRICNLTG